jgi:hypothetical protein
MRLWPRRDCESLPGGIAVPQSDSPAGFGLACKERHSRLSGRRCPPLTGSSRLTAEGLLFNIEPTGS